jgi:hypothetical protein
MKKIIKTIIILAILLTIVSCGNYPSNLTSETNATEAQKIQMPASITQYDISGAELLKETYIYDAKGQLIEENSVFEDYSTKILYIYNENGQITEEKQINSFDGIQEIYIFKYEYDIKGNQISKIRLSANNETLSKTSYEYDNKNRLITVSDEAMNQINSYMYESDTNYSVKYEYSYGDNTIFNIIDYELDKNGNIIRQLSYAQNSKDIIEQEISNEYDEYGKIRSSKTYMFGELIDLVEYEYNKDLLIKKRLSDANGIYMIEEFEYNEFNNLKKSTRKSKSGVVMNYFIYEYVEKKN